MVSEGIWTDVEDARGPWLQQGLWPVSTVFMTELGSGCSRSGNRGHLEGLWPEVSLLWGLPWQQDVDLAKFQPALLWLPEVACVARRGREASPWSLAPCPLAGELPGPDAVLLWLN